MVNGNLLLTFSDLVLPGNAGMDLHLQRTFNKQAGATGLWSFGLAGIPMKVLSPDAPWLTGEPERARPTLLMADGSSVGTAPYSSSTATDVWITERFWRYTLATRKVEMPNGWTATYSQDAAALLEQVEDPFGNRITVEWEESDPALLVRRPIAFRQHFGSGERLVTLTYETTWLPIPKTMTYDDRVWTYNYEYIPNGPTYLTSVDAPEEQTWSFDYSTGLKVTTPLGGTVSYTFDSQVLIEEPAKTVVRSRTIGGREVPQATWSFTYSQRPDALMQGTAAGPNGIALEFRHEWSTAGRWILKRKALIENGIDVSALDRSYTFLSVAPWTAAWVPAIASETITQDGKSGTTTFEYRANNEANFFGDHHRPWKVTETGDLTRVTTRAFDYDLTINLSGPLKSETVTVGGQSFTRSFEHHDNTGFMTSQLVYGISTTFGHDAAGNRNSATDANNHVTTFTYEWGALRDTVTPEYTISRTINSDFGTVATETRGGSTTTFDYDDLGRLQKVSRPGAVDTGTSYEADNVTVWRGQSFDTTYLDGFGRPIGTESSTGARTQIDYNAHGRKTFASDAFEVPPQGSPVIRGDTFHYDALGRVRRVVHADSSEITYSYGTGGNAGNVTITDENGHATVQRWRGFADPADARLLELRDAEGKEWQYTFDALGSLTKVKAPDNKERVWVYNGKHQLVTETHPESGTVTFEYDNAGNLKKKTDGERILEYRYDDNDRLIKILTPAGSDDVTIGYDDFDNRLTLSVANGASTVFGYTQGRLTGRTDTIDGKTFSTAYGFDDHDNLTSITYPNGHVIHYDFDTKGDRLTKVRGNVGAGEQVFAETIGYYPSGALKSFTYGNGQTESISLDDRQRPDLWNSGPLSINYDHDVAGNVTQITDGRGAGFTMGFGYDALDRLKTVTGLISRTYDYDDHGNRTAATGYGYTYDPTTLRMMSVTAPIEYGGGSLTYDDVGNMETDPSGAAYGYTPFNMMRTATLGSATTGYSYDGDNLRIRRTGATGNDYFVRDPAGRLLSEFGVRCSELQWQRNYIYLGDRLLASVRGGSGPSVGVTLSNVSVAEGIGSITLTVRLSTSAPLGCPLTLKYATANGTAMAGADYTAASGTLTFNTGDADGAERQVSLTILDDLRVDVPATKSFTFAVSDASQGSLGTASTTITILDNDVAPGEGSDFDLDGLADLVWQHEGTGDLVVWFMNGTTMTSNSALTPGQVADTNWKVIGTGDFNHDGKADLLWHHRTQGLLAAWMMNGTQQLAGTALSPDRVTDTNWKPMAMGDFDGDGQRDILWQHETERWLSVWLMNGLTLKDGHLLTPDRVASTEWRMAGTGDFNGDHKTDIVWHNQVTGHVSVMLMNGSTLIDGVWLTPDQMPDTNWKVAAVTDVNADGKPDLIWQHLTNGSLVAWVMNGLTRTATISLTPGFTADLNWRIKAPK